MRWNTLSVASLGLLIGPDLTRASYHLMEIQQVIGGVEGNTAAQAVQLRMREARQEMVAQSRIRAFDAQGNNPVVLITFDANVTNAQMGESILITSGEFDGLTDPPAAADFAMTNRIPDSHLAAGSLTFEGPDGTVLWRLCWGGAAYSGPQTGSKVNDNDGNFGPPLDGPLPSTSLSSILITRPAGNLSTNSATDYSLSTGPAVFTNNVRQSFTLVDRCPDDPAKAAPGVCGCGIADADRDADGRADCVDPCPDNPADVTADACSGADETPDPSAGSPRPAFTGCGVGAFQASLPAGVVLLFLRPARTRRR